MGHIALSRGLYPSKRPTVADRRAQHRLTWRAIQWRVWLSEAHRSGRGLVVGCPCVDLLEHRDECRDYCDYHRNGEKYDGDAAAIPLVTHEGVSTPSVSPTALGRNRLTGAVSDGCHQRYFAASATTTTAAITNMTICIQRLLARPRLLVFLHSHGVSPLEIFLMAISQSPQFPNQQRL